MSTDVADPSPTSDGETDFKTADTGTMLRFAFGVTLAVALSQVVDWQVSFLTPVLLALLLQAPRALPIDGALSFVVILALVAVTATLVPVWRAMRVDPARVLSVE